MRAWYFDGDDAADQKLPHRCGPNFPCLYDHFDGWLGTQTHTHSPAHPRTRRVGFGNSTGHHGVPVVSRAEGSAEVPPEELAVLGLLHWHLNADEYETDPELGMCVAVRWGGGGGGDQAFCVRVDGF